MRSEPMLQRAGSSSWLIVAAGFVAYLALVFALGVTRITLDVPLPWWAAQVVPPVLYTLHGYIAMDPALPWPKRRFYQAMEWVLGKATAEYCFS